jgi:hypothetical protein
MYFHGRGAPLSNPAVVKGASRSEAQQVDVAGQAVKLGEHHGSPDGLRVRESLCKLWTVTALAALSLNVLSGQCPSATVQVAFDSGALRCHTPPRGVSTPRWFS